MNSEWELVERLFYVACELSPQERVPFLDRECGSNKAVRDKVEALLEHHGTRSDILDTSVATVNVIMPAGTLVGPYEVIEVSGSGGGTGLSSLRKTPECISVS